MSNRNILHGQTTHRHSTPEYKAWTAMRQRCNNPNFVSYHRYGGRGISVCKRWDSFAKFFQDMGYRPGEGFSLDRIDNDRDYEPSNCRWATAAEQAINKINLHWLEFNGQKKTLSQWGASLGMRSNMILRRLQRGWSVQKTLTTPSTKHLIICSIVFSLLSGCLSAPSLPHRRVAELFPQAISPPAECPGQYSYFVADPDGYTWFEYCWGTAAY